ncbi:MAG: hypothetical protein AAF645_01240 [Myxococcota bacterium]
MAEPLVRAAVSQTLLRTLRRVRPDAAKHVDGTLSSAARANLESLNALRWIPMDHHMELSDRIREFIGAGERYRVFWQDVFDSLLRRPIFHRFVDMAMRMLESPAESLLHFAPRMYGHIFQECGECSIEVKREANQLGMLTIAGWPGERYEFDGFVEAMHGSIEGAGGLIPGCRFEVETVELIRPGLVRLRIWAHET